MRLNLERQKALEPKRIRYVKDQLQDLGFEITYEDNCKLKFKFKGEDVAIFPYSGWHSGKSIKDGRGLRNLIQQLKS